MLEQHTTSCVRLCPGEPHHELMALTAQSRPVCVPIFLSKDHDESAPAVHTEKRAPAVAREAAQAPSGVGGAASNQPAVAVGPTDREVAAPQHAAAGSRGAPGPMEHTVADVDAPSSAPGTGNGPAAP